MRVRVIGVGTRHGDDAAGLIAAEQLARSILPAGAEVLTCERPAPELIDLLAGAEAVVLIDAVAPAGSPGRVHRASPAELRSARAFSSHALGVAEALALVEALGRRPQRIELVGIEAERTTGNGLSAPVAQSLTEATALARALARELGRGS